MPQRWAAGAVHMWALTFSARTTRLLRTGATRTAARVRSAGWALLPSRCPTKAVCMVAAMSVNVRNKINVNCLGGLRLCGRRRRGTIWMPPEDVPESAAWRGGGAQQMHSSAWTTGCITNIKSWTIKLTVQQVGKECQGGGTQGAGGRGGPRRRSPLSRLCVSQGQQLLHRKQQVTDAPPLPPAPQAAAARRQTTTPSPEAPFSAGWRLFLGR